MRGASKTAALIPAAGCSTRMGVFKPLLPLGNSTILESAVSSFLDAGIKNILVVLGHRADEVLSILKPLDVRWTFNPRYDEGMFASIQAGARHLQPGVEAFFILPGDIALVSPETIVGLLHAQSESTASIVHPRFRGHRGHPPLISAAFLPELLRWEQPGGLRTFLQQYAPHTLDLEVEDENILLDCDTPDDYERLLARSRRSPPVRQGC